MLVRGRRDSRRERREVSLTADVEERGATEGRRTALRSGLPGVVVAAVLALGAFASGGAALAVPPSPAAGVDAGGEESSAWPGWRGPRRDGTSPETGLVRTWPADGPPVLWRHPIGAGYSGISVADGRGFTLDQSDGRQRAIAFDVVDGRELWTRELGPGFGSQYGDGPRATPLVAGGRVFVVDAGARVASLGAESGEPEWAVDLVESHGARPPSIGFSSTPVIEGGRLILEAGAEKGAYLALDAATGELVWSSGSDDSAYAAPIVADLAGRRQVVFFSGSGLHALDPRDGTRLWHEPWRAPCPATGIPLATASPVVVAPDRLFAASAWGERKGGAVYRIAATDGGFEAEEVWHDPTTIDGQMHAPVRVGHTLYGFKGSILLAVAADSGEIVWSARGFGRGSLIAADGLLIVLGERGNLALFEATPTELRKLAEAQLLEGRSWTAPSLAEGRLFARNGTERVSVDLRARSRR